MVALVAWATFIAACIARIAAIAWLTWLIRLLVGCFGAFGALLRCCSYGLGGLCIFRVAHRAVIALTTLFGAGFARWTFSTLWICAVYGCAKLCRTCRCIGGILRVSI